MRNYILASPPVCLSPQLALSLLYEIVGEQLEIETSVVSTDEKPLLVASSWFVSESPGEMF